MPKSRLNLKPIKIEHKDLTSDGVWGWAYQDENRIELEKNQTSKEYLNTLIHEMLHCMLPDLKEPHIEKMADMLANEVWRRKFRKIAK